MDVSPRVSRRHFLYGSALAAGSALLAACSSSSSDGGGSSDNGGGSSGSGSGSGGAAESSTPNIGGKAGSARKPLPAPTSFTESPTLKGKGLPAVEDRLPEHPYVVPHNWITRGKYGGTMRMPTFGSTGMLNAGEPQGFYYGHSFVRWLNDGIDIGPGIAEKWTSNNDATQWTISFRKGLKWSDGHLFDVDDVLFWYNDMALQGHHAMTPTAGCLSANGKPCQMTRVDGSTLKLTYDSPQPLVPDYLAAFVGGDIGNDAWLFPKHYLKQYHPKYNKNVPKDWDTVGGLWERKAKWWCNPDCPTLTGYKCKSFDNNGGSVLERNPYYYAVTKDGDQLPYIDEVATTIFQDDQVIKLQVQQGKFDFVHGPNNHISLADVSGLSKVQDKSHFTILMWDSGSGTGSMFFLNLDYPDKKYRDLFNDKRFRQAISLAWDRKTARKTLYFETGEITTGTMSPKAMEFHAKPDGPNVYKKWRDSFKDQDVKRAKSLFAEIGLKDTNGDGYVEFPDGSKLTIEIAYAADIPDTEAAKDDQLVSDLKKAGLHMVRRPIPAQAFGLAWNDGQYMARTNWEVGDGPNCLVYPQWLAPLEASRWAPLQGMFYAVKGTPKEHAEQNVDPWKRHPPRREPEAGSPTAKLVDLYNQTKREPDEMKRSQLVWKIMNIHIDEGPFFMGCDANYPQVMTHHVDMMNVPEKKNLAQGGFVNPSVMATPAAYDPETWFWSNPDEHT
ncbi:MAG TPA: ABC transporter substrate-binding protein [Mycobacteriales bacterium]|nr:ABC transporter substrate-binding protein [Mycobacteriales bacterium]